MNLPLSLKNLEFSNKTLMKLKKLANEIKSSLLFISLSFIACKKEPHFKTWINH